MADFIANKFVKMFVTAKDGTREPASKRRSVSLVERCARTVEKPCGACREPSCQRCLIAAELRASEPRIDAEDDADFIMGFEKQLDETIDQMVGALCDLHRTFGPVVVLQWSKHKASFPA